MSKKFYRLYCEVCNWKKITDGTDIDLFKLKTSNIPGGVPKLDPVSKKTITPKSIKQPKKYRCPNCGRVVIPRKISNPQEKIDQHCEELEQERKKIEWENLDQERKKSYEESKEEYEKEQDRLDGC